MVDDRAINIVISLRFYNKTSKSSEKLFGFAGRLYHVPYAVKRNTCTNFDNKNNQFSTSPKVEQDAAHKTLL